MTNFRNLTESEISSLENQGCRCKDWSKVQVHINFSIENIIRTEFSGDIKLGFFEKEFTLENGVSKHSGIFDSSIHNCSIGNNVYISKVNCHLANYIIQDNVYIENTAEISTTGLSAFGNGTKVAVINEAGGREIPICNITSAHIACLSAVYNNKDISRKIEHLTEQYCKKIKSKIGVIEKNAVIRNCSKIINVYVGENAVLDGCAELQNGSINSSATSPSAVGMGVSAKDFIISTDCQVTDFAMIERCFVGQGSQVSKQFSATDTFFACNCQAFHGEAVSLFAGPYTVSHHKSTLLIASMFSFFNAGSGTNQSNHMYKLGPIHEGIVERGSKAGSFSYILWPARVGAFSLIKGKHTSNTDTTDLPFSYLIENNGETFIVPGANLKSAGTLRDSLKWENRDKRNGDNVLDKITFSMLNPYTIGRIQKGIKLLKKLKETTQPTDGTYIFNNAKIKASSLEKGIDVYTKAVYSYIGDLVSERIASEKNLSKEIIDDILNCNDTNTDTWLDIAGLLSSKTEIDKICDDLTTGNLSSLEELNERLSLIHNDYKKNEWEWVKTLISQITENENSKEKCLEILSKWIDAKTFFENSYIADAEKEYSDKIMTGYGCHSETEIRFEKSQNTKNFIESRNEVLEEKIKLYKEIAEKLKNIRL